MTFFGLGITENDRCLILVDDTKFEVYGSTIPDDDSINAIRQDPVISDLRESSGADFVPIISGNSGPCGIGGLYDWPLITSHHCLMQYTMTHEIGHNFGCHHNRQAFIDQNNEQNHPYSYGYVDPTHSYRTFESYRCKMNTACPRVPVFQHQAIKHQMDLP
jgi:hypothetical protein